MTVIQFIGELQIFFLDTIFRVAIRILPGTYLLDYGAKFPKVEISRHGCMHLLLRFTICIIINQHDAAVRSQFYFAAGSLYMFRVLSTPIIRSTL